MEEILDKQFRILYRITMQLTGITEYRLPNLQARLSQAILHRLPEDFERAPLPSGDD